MKIGILSRHSVANYGSILQAYALEKTLKDLGYEPININYTPKCEVGGNLAKTLLEVSKWRKNIFMKSFFYCYQYISCTITFNRFKKYRDELLKQTKMYISSDELRNDIPNVDLFCTGSDQVWNILYNNKIDDTYFFDFLPDECYRISYASSFGGYKFEHNDIEKYKNYLEKYSYVTVREDSGLEILKSFGIDGKQVLDPTLLLSERDWKTISSEGKIKGDYILVYQLRHNKNFDHYAKELSLKTGLKIVRISTMFYQKFKNGTFCYLPSPAEFLWYINNAKCLLTDSFHGTCFAVNFHTPFIEILPGRFNSRNESLLRIMGLEDRILKDYQDFDIYDKVIDWEKVDKKLNTLRNKSLEILKCELDTKSEK